MYEIVMEKNAKGVYVAIAIYYNGAYIGPRVNIYV
jgi:hypothetical protein